MAEAVEYVIASDVSTRDGIGVEVWVDGKIVLELFRDDTKRTKTLTAFVEDVPIETVEAAIEVFKKKIPSEFIVLPWDTDH